MTTELALLLALAFGCGLIVAVALLLDRRVSVGPRLSRPAQGPPCPMCGKPLTPLAAMPSRDAAAFAARGLPVPDYLCARRCCSTADNRVVYCYAVRPGEPVRLGPPKPAPEEEV
jgi:hypothetical protein